VEQGYFRSSVPALRFEGPEIGTVGNYLLQAVQDPDSGHRVGDGDGSFDAGHEQVEGLLSGDDLRGFPGRET